MGNAGSDAADAVERASVQDESDAGLGDLSFTGYHLEGNQPRQSISVCLACHQNLMEDYERAKTEKIKTYMKTFLLAVYNTDENTVFNWTTYDTSNADIVVPDSTTWIDDGGGVFVPENMAQRSDEFDVIVSVFCPIVAVDPRDVGFTYKLLKRNGIFIVLGCRSAQEFVDTIVNGRINLSPWNGGPIQSALPSAPVPVYYHDSVDQYDRFGVFQKV